VGWRTATLACCSLFGCAPGLEQSQVGRLRVLEGSFAAGGDGRITLEVVPEPGETRLVVTGIPLDPEHSTHLRGLVMPDGEWAYDAEQEVASDRKRSNAGYLSPITTLNWPILPSDRPLEPGRAHRLELGLADGLAYTAGWMRVVATLAPAPEPRRLKVDLVHYGSVADDLELRAASVGAVERWRSLYAPIGVELEVVERDLAGGSIGVPNGADDSALWRWIAQSGPADHLRVVLAPDAPDDNPVILGVAGGVPGPWTASARTGVRITPSRICGVDALCDADEVRMYGEVLAHEAGHHLGLFHPVETDWAVWDALSDTVECADATTCEASLAGNLMFPYARCDGERCEPQEDITPLQSDVLNGYLGVE
jgi:hypothetical protein